MQSPIPLGINDNIYREFTNSKMPNFVFFSLSECKKRKCRSHGKRKMATFVKFVQKNAKILL